MDMGLASASAPCILKHQAYMMFKLSKSRSRCGSVVVNLVLHAREGMRGRKEERKGKTLFVYA